MEAENHGSDDEVFMGEITVQEMRNPLFNSRRRTTLYLPGITRPDSSVSVFREVTEDGTLIFSCEDMEPTETQQTTENKVSDQKVESSTVSGIFTLLGNSETEPDQMESAGVDGLGGIGCSSQSSETNDSGYGSVGDGWVITPDFGNNLFQVPESREKMAASEDRHRKCFAGFCSGGKTVRQLSPDVGFSPVTGFPCPSEMCTPEVKRQFACGEMSKPRGSVQSPCGQISLLENSESAFSKLHLKSPKYDFDLKSVVSPVVKDFPKYFERNSGDNSATPTSDSFHFVAPLKRKIAKRSPSADLKTDDKSDTDKTRKRKELAGKPSSHTQLEGKTKQPLCYTYSPNCTLPENKMAIRAMQQSNNSCDPSSDASEIPELDCVVTVDRTVSAGGDAHAARQSAESVVCVPETPDTRNSDLNPVTQLHQQTSGEGCADGLCHRKAEQEARTSPPSFNKNSFSAFTPVSEHSTSAGFSSSVDSSSSPDLSASSLNQSAGASPDRFPSETSSRSSTTRFNKSLSSESEYMLPLNQSAGASPELFPSDTSTTRFNKSLISYMRPPCPRESSPTPTVDESVPSGRVSNQLKPTLTSEPPQLIRECDMMGTVNKMSAAVGSNPLGRLPGVVTESQEREKPKRAKYPLLRKRSPKTVGEGNKENAAEEPPSSFIVPFGADSQRLMKKRSRVFHQTGQFRVNISTVQGSTRPTIADDHGGKASAKYQGFLTLAHLQDHLQSPSQFHSPVAARPTFGGTPPGMTYIQQVPTEEEVKEEAEAAVTRVNTLINGETRLSLLDPQSSPALLTEFPAPKEASRVSWSDMLGEEANLTRSPVFSPTTPRSILLQRPVDHEFPFSKDPPSPIILTRKRLPKFTRLFSDDG